MLEDERRDRGRIVESLRSTIQRVRASGNEEDRLQSEVMHLTGLLSEQKQKKEEGDRVLAMMSADVEDTRARLKQAQALYDDLQINSRATERSLTADLSNVRPPVL